MRETDVEMEQTTLKLFDMYDVSEVIVKDESLKPYLNLQPKILLKSYGRNIGKFGKARVNIVERFANRISVPGHSGRKHKIITGNASGKYNKNMMIMIGALEFVKNKTGKNPIQVLMRLKTVRRATRLQLLNRPERDIRSRLILHR